MKRKKTVGEIFRDEFKAEETTPPENVWSKIELSLEKRRKKRFAIPFWYRAAAIAAIFAIIMGIILSPDPELQNSENSEVSDAGLRPEWQNSSVENFNKINKDSSIIHQSLVLQGNKSSVSVIKEAESNHIQERTKPELISHLNVEQGPVIDSSSADFLHSPKKGLDFENEKFDNLGIVNHEQIPEQDSKREGKFLDRLVVSTIAGIIYSDNLKKGSFIDRDLSSFSNRGVVSFSYGIKLSYGLTERLNMRTGFSSINLGYRTDDVGVYSALSADAVDKIAMVPEDSFTGNLHQDIGLFEIPVEFSYALVDKRIRLNLIAGASGLFLNSNSLSLIGATSTLNLGAANNLNSVSISGNLGLGLDYSIQKNLHLTLEPIFKYQFNTFKSTSPGIAPYMMGLHTGLNYRF